MALFSKKSPPPEMSGMSLDELLFLADTQEDPILIHQALTRAEALAPDDPAIQKRLLLLGRLHERNPRNPDMGVIKSYLLHAFEHPEKFEEKALRQMAGELTGEERLKKAMAMAPNPGAFLEEYYLDLSREYLRIFIASDNTHIPRVLGISFRGNKARYLAVPAGDVIKNIFSSPYLSHEEARTLARAFYRAYHEHNQGEVKQLDALLGAQICALLR